MREWLRSMKGFFWPQYAAELQYIEGVLEEGQILFAAQNDLFFYQ